MRYVGALGMMLALAVTSSARADEVVVAFDSWGDPGPDHSFTVDAPRGWRIEGGTRWKGPTDVRQYVRATAPDGRMTVFVDDPDIVARTVPHPSHAAAGAREGSVLSLPTGPVLLQRFLTGREFAKMYVRNRVCPDAVFVQESDDGAASERMTRDVQPYANQLGGWAKVSAGQVGFACGTDLGMVQATTLLSGSRSAPIQPWVVMQMAGFRVADARQATLARYVMDRMAATLRIAEAWQQAYRQRIQDVTGATMAMQNAVAADSRRRSSANAETSLSRLNHPNAGVPRRAEGKTSSVNPVLGTKTVCDSIGRCQSVSTSMDSVYIDHSGRAAAGRAGGGPPDNSGVWTPAYTQ